MQIELCSKEDNFENDINDLLATFRKKTPKLINIKISVSYIFPNLLIFNPKLDLEYILYATPPHYQSYDELYDLVAKSTVYDTLPSNRLDRFIYNLEHEDKQYTKEIEILINDLLEKRGIQRREYNYLDIINKWYFSANFDFIDNDVFNWSISVYYSKISKIQEVTDLAIKLRNKEEDIVLGDKFFSSFFNKESHKEIVYRKTTFLKTSNSCSDSDLSLNINFGSNILTIFCNNIDKRIINEDTLGLLWPGLILRLEDFWWWKKEGIESLLKLVVNGDGTKRGKKLMFEKIEFKN